MKLIQATNYKCQHDVKFMCLDLGSGYTWHCGRLCGFTLNFNPDTGLEGPVIIQGEEVYYEVQQRLPLR